jgi:hypothetical protein
MKKLGVNNYNLISRGVKCMGTFDPNQIFCMFEEQLLMSEVDEIWNFLEWVHANDKTFGHGNYEAVFAEWKAAA